MHTESSQNVNLLNKMNIHIKVALGIFFTSIALAFIYFFYFHNTLYIDGTVKNTGRLLPSNNNGSIKFTQVFKISGQQQSQWKLMKDAALDKDPQSVVFKVFIAVSHTLY